MPEARTKADSLPAAEAVSLLTRRQWREGDVTALRAAVERLGLGVPLAALTQWPGRAA
jgi:hypothetical protein